MPMMSVANLKKITPYLFLLPTFTVLILVNIYPLIWGFIISLQEYKVTFSGIVVNYIGFNNYLLLLNDNLFIQSLLNTIIYSFTSVALQFLLGLMVALSLNENFRGRTFFRTVILIPWVMPTVAASYLFKWLFHPFLGMINDILYTKLHLTSEPLLWLNVAELAFPTAILVNLWKGFPFYAVMLLASLQSIPESLYEAAKIDGADRFQRFRYITLPSITFISMVLIILGLVWNFNGVTLIYTLTGGGPGYATLISPVYAYNIAFTKLHYGYGSAMGWFIFPFTLTLIFLYTWLMLKKE
jgi:multiple sugar transport system permease protein